MLPLILNRDSLTYDICESGSGGILNVAIHYIDGTVFLKFFLLTLVKRTGVSCEHIAINSCPDLMNRRQTGFVLRI